MTVVNYPGPGCIVEYMEANAPQIALVVEEQGGKLRLLLPNRRETSMNANRLLPWSGPVLADVQSGKENLIKALQGHKDRRYSIATKLNALNIWELAVGELEQATAQWFAELFEESPSVDTIAAYGHALLQCKSHFKFQPPHFEIYSQEIVEQKLNAQEEARKRESLISGGAAFFRLLWDVWNKKATLPPQGDSRWPSADVLEYLENILRKRIADPETSDDSTTYAMLMKGLPDVQHLPLQLAMAWGLLPVHYNFWLDRADYDADNGWADEYAESIQGIVNKVKEVTTPSLDLPFISIDSSTTRDIDDAFFVEELENGVLRLHLALACPALLWPFDDAENNGLDKAVFRRATSLYLPEATYHMLPESLGIGALSLIANEVRPSLCVLCDVDADGQILSCEPSIEWVRLGANLCYEDCEAVLNNNAQAENPALVYAAQLELGNKLANIRQKKRIADGAVIMDNPDNKIILQGEGAETLINIEETPPSPQAQMLVAEMMILASGAIAAWGQERNVALLYRTQDVAIPREYAGLWQKPQDMARVIRALIPSSLETQPRPHAGLALSSYAPITSPLRRYSDLVNEAQIVHILLHGEARYTAEALQQMLIALNMRLDATSQVQRFRPRYWRLSYLRQCGDKKWWDAIITEENDNYVSINVPSVQISLRGKRRLFGERAHPGQEVSVRIGKVHPLYNEVAILEAMDL